MIRIALFSDFHFKAKEDLVQKNTLEKYIDNFEEFISKGDWIDLVIVSGDITKSGTREDFKKALIFFNRIKETLNLSPKDFIFIPGNHDYSRNDTGINFKYIDKINLDRYNIIFNSKDFERHINKAFKNFNEFLRDFKGKIPPLKGYCIDENYVDINLHITVANSCLTNTIGDDKLQPYINIDNIKKCLISKESKDLSIFLMHHPLSHLYTENNRILHNLISESSDILISGHEHVPNYLQSQTVGGNEYISITNGCAFIDRKDNLEERYSRFCVLEYDPIKALLTLNPWFKTKNMTHFGRDTSLYSSAKDDGIIKFIIKSKGPQAIDEEVDDPLEHVVINNVIEDYFYRNFDKIQQANDDESIFKIKKDIKNKYKFNFNINRLVLSFLKYILINNLVESFSDLNRLLNESFLFSKIRNIKKKIKQFYNEIYFEKLNEDLSVKISKKHKKLRLDELKIKLSETEEKLKKYEASRISIIETYKDRPKDHFPPLILDIEEIEIEPFDWYKKINLVSNPFPSSDGLENIKEEMFEDIIYPTKIIQTFKEKITSNEISDLINKTIGIYGSFGSGKTTLFQYMQKLLKQFYPKILILTISLEARASLDEIRRSFFLKLHSRLKKIHIEEIGHALKEKDLENDCYEMIRNLSINWRALFIFIEDIYKHSSIGVFIEEILGFIKALQIYRKDFSVDSFKTSFYFSSIGEIIQRIRDDHSISGSVDMYSKMSPIILDTALEMINKRLKAFSINPEEPALITREFLSRLKTIAKQNGTPIITFRDYINILLTRFRRLEFTEDSISIHSDDQILLTLKKDIESKHNEINKSFLELKQRSKNKIEYFNKFLSVLDELWSNNPIVEGDKRYFKNKAFLAHLHDVNLIKKIIVESRPAWTVSDTCRDYCDKINNQYGLFPSSILPALYFTGYISQIPDNKYLLALNNTIQRSEEYGATFLNLLIEISKNYEDLDLLSSSYHVLKDESINESEIDKIRKSLEKMIIVLVLLCDSNTDNFDSAIIKYEKSWFEIPEITSFINDLNVYYDDPYPTIDQKALLLKNFLQITKIFISKIKRLIQWDNIFKLNDRKIWKENKKKLNSIRQNLESDNFDLARYKILALIKEALKNIIFDYLRILYGEKNWIKGLPEENLSRINKLKESDKKYELYNFKELYLDIPIQNLLKIVKHISYKLIKGNNDYFSFIIEKGLKIMKAIGDKNPWISETLDLIEYTDSFFEKLFYKEIITPWTLSDGESIHGIIIQDNLIEKAPIDINYGFPLSLDRFLTPILYSTNQMNIRNFVEIILTKRYKFNITINYREEKFLIIKVPYV